jgi:penicillin-binding protein 1A
MSSAFLHWLRLATLGLAGLVLAAGFALACTFVYLAPSLPTAQTMHSKELAVPLRVYTISGEVIAQIGEELRVPVSYQDVPDLVRHAVLAAEDDRFFEHGGLDWMGVLRALVRNVLTADAGQGGSTISQQAARNMFLSLDKNLRRKLSEVFVTYRMERDFTKEQILAVYLNVARFGHRSAGIAAAAQRYYNKHLDELTVSQAATLVGLLPAPSNYNPITNPRLATVRRNYVLGRMTRLGYIDAATEAAARKESVATPGYAPKIDVEAPYVTEMVRQEFIRRFGRSALNAGYKVFTTIDGREQTAGNLGVRLELLRYDRRHGYRGSLGKVQLPDRPSDGELEILLKEFESINLLHPAVVTLVRESSADVYIRGIGKAGINWDGLKWARPVNNEFSAGAADVVTAGDVIFVVTDRRGVAELAQLPRAQGALIALNPDDGAVVSLVGGFDYFSSKFNRVTQAQRQPGSGFKPFLYSAALENGFTAATGIPDLPVVETCNDEDCWRPENSGGGYGGLMRLREALVQSRNLVARRILRHIGLDAAIEHAGKFGLRKESMPRSETLALGTLAATPLEMATAYAVFANGGFKVEPYYISRIEDYSGKVVFEARPKIACGSCEPTETPRTRFHDVAAPPLLRELAREQGGPGYLSADRLAPRVISTQNAWLMSDILHDVTVRGTAQRSRALGRDDLAGKTGTTDDYVDNWFNGFNRNLVAAVWVGIDDRKSLGAGEEGSRTALPVWMHFMGEALRALPHNRLERPDGLVDLRVSPTTGLLADQTDPAAVFETFMVERLPQSAGGEDALIF